jgi:hypothetical protein
MSVLGVCVGVLQVSGSIKDIRRRRIAYVPTDVCVWVCIICVNIYIYIYIYIYAIPVAARSKAWVWPLACWDCGFESRLSLVSVECCMLSGRGLCDGLITHPEEAYRVLCFSCVIVQPRQQEAVAHDAQSRH